MKLRYLRFDSSVAARKTSTKTSRVIAKGFISPSNFRPDFSTQSRLFVFRRDPVGGAQRCSVEAVPRPVEPQAQRYNIVMTGMAKIHGKAIFSTWNE